jgi:hypothetical protein
MVQQEGGSGSAVGIATPEVRADRNGLAASETTKTLYDSHGDGGSSPKRRRVREELFAEAGYDIHEFFRRLREGQATSGHPVVNL